MKNVPSVRTRWVVGMLVDPGPDRSDTRALLAKFRQMLASVGVYDAALAAIPLALVAGALVGASQFLPMHAGVSAGSLGGIAAIGYCTFWNPPLADDSA